jgi:hypothetical protein
VLSTVSDEAVQGHLTVLPYDPTKTAGRQFTLGDDGFIHLSSDPTLVLDVQAAVAKESTPVLAYPKKSPVADNQQWVNKGGVLYSKLEGEEFSLALIDGNVVISKTRQVLVIGYQGFAEAAQGDTINITHPLTNFTVTAVINLQAPWNGRIVDKITANTADGWLLDIWPNTTPRVISNNIAESHVRITNSDTTYIAATYGPPETGIFINGARTDTINLHPPPQNTLPVRIGFDSNGQNKFPGNIRRARIYYSVLSDAQIAADFQDAKTSLSFR